MRTDDTIRAREYQRTVKKTDIIDRLEGRTIRTADMATHKVENGAFVSSHGGTVHLADLHKFHLASFLAESEGEETRARGNHAQV